MRTSTVYVARAGNRLIATLALFHPKTMGHRQEVFQREPSDAIRLDAFDADAGAGEFYSKCGFREVGRASYRSVPLIYFEMLV